ncbi:DUF881 domain-containing protein [Actinopolymorpha singaporensis]|uniref:Uncharacterized conserved protein YlxW, UPF0749 family n=1 Tax=Actinopolymorpha singaporensis TaxID=117157 RepID=A0A1H1WXV0_9ACTN|nr:DUF881 domain-containing protein [Actinopolymorpha singaporensis]SDT01551.1 Uncharacterized conserved protein YlxW, UPF0749 family [Actinopolymorpha singaporensis]
MADEPETPGTEPTGTDAPEADAPEADAPETTSTGTEPTGTDTPEAATSGNEATGAKPTGTDDPTPAGVPATKPIPARPRNAAWRRLAGAFRPHTSRAQVAAAVLLAALGFAATVQVRALRNTDEFTNADRTQLIQIMDGLQQRSRRLETDIGDLQRSKAELVSGADRRRSALEQAQTRAQTLGILAGTLPATGPGIRLTITDDQAAVNASLVLNTIEELRDAGAEAIEINDRVRVVASSYVLDGQGGIIVDGKLLPAPYTIDAIGDARTLATAMRIPGGVVDEVSQKGGLASVLERQTIQVSSLHRVASPRYARPAPDKSPGSSSR